MLIGYARTSTVEQVAGLAQLAQLKAQGAEKVFQERVSSVARREQLEAGDVLAVTKPAASPGVLPTSSRSPRGCRRRGWPLRVIDMNLDTATPTGRLLLGSIAQFERELIARTLAGGYRQGEAGRRPLAGRPRG
jgi:DNA invertase Pin-like site-specific DNA recombinase